jgi:hypothetical protein
MKNAIGAILIFGGLVVAAGSAGDCDGKCMEYANSLSTMLMIAAAGMAMVAAGFYLVKDSLFEQ